MFASAVIDWGIFVVLVGLAIAIILVARVARMVSASLPGIHLELGQVNKAVNHVQDGEAPLIQQVRNISKSICELKDQFALVHARLDVLENELFSSSKTAPVDTQSQLF